MRPVNCNCDMPYDVYCDWLDDMGWDASELRMCEYVAAGESDFIDDTGCGLGIDWDYEYGSTGTGEAGNGESIYVMPFGSSHARGNGDGNGNGYGYGANDYFE